MQWPSVFVDWLEESEMTQTEVAEKLGCSQGAISAWVRSDRFPDVNHQLALAALMGEDFGQLAQAVADVNPATSRPRKKAAPRRRKKRPDQAAQAELDALMSQAAAPPQPAEPPPRAPRKRQ